MAKRIIFTLLFEDGYFVQSRNFKLQRVGDFNWLRDNYNFKKISSSIDELIVLNISRNDEFTEDFLSVLSLLSDETFIPISSGGGIKKIVEVENLFKNGADKVVINSLLFSKPKFIESLADRYGNQAIIASVDIKKDGDAYFVWSNCGSIKQPILIEDWLKTLSKFPIGEILVHSIDNDGVGEGMEIGIKNLLPEDLTMPVILSGGAGKPSHLIEALRINHFDAVATANLFNFIGNGLQLSREKIIFSKIELPEWDPNLIELNRNIFTN